MTVEVDGVIRRYFAELPNFAKFTEGIRDLLTCLIETTETAVWGLESRTKTIESFAEKIERKGLKYADPISEMTDISGCRIIFLFNDDIAVVENLIRESFLIDE